MTTGDRADARPGGGIDHVVGGLVNAVTDPRGPVNMGAGTQYYFEHAIFHAEEPAPPRSPRLIAEDILRDLARRFVAPRSFGRLRQRMREPGMLLLTGAPGTGRRTAALMLLHASGDGATRFRELPDDAGDSSTVRLDPDAIEAGERLLLDLSDEPGRLARLGSALVAYHSAVLGNGAYCVVVLPVHTDGLPQELAHLSARIERPDGRAVLRRHLEALGITSSDTDLDVAGLASHLESDPMRELARLASLVDETREAAEGRGTTREWIEQAVAALAVPLDAVAAQVSANPDGRFRALLLVAAMFERTPAEVVDHATDVLLTALEFPDADIHRLERPDLTESLRRIDARTDGEQRVRFATVTYGNAVRTHFWNSFPALRPTLRRWLDTALRTPLLRDHDRIVVLRRFSAQCLRTRHVDDLFWLVDQWTQDSRARNLIAAAATALADGLADEEHGATFRRRIYLWSCTYQLRPALALELVRLCAEAIAPTRPEQALVRLRHLTRNVDPVVSAAARDTLVDLAADDDRFLRRVLHRLADDLNQPRPRDTDLRLFAELTDLLLSAHQAGAGDAALDLLVEATGGRGALLGHLYVVTRDWARVDPARRRTAAELLRRSDRAQGLDLTAGATATEGAVR